MNKPVENKRCKYDYSRPVNVNSRTVASIGYRNTGFEDLRILDPL